MPNDERHDLSHSENSAPNLAFDTMPVQLTFTAGEIVIPLHQLYALNSGAVIHLERQVSTVVNIAANGAFIGTGELVDLDGQLAVEVKTLKGLS